MKIKSENIELRNKIMEGVNKAVKQLVIESAEKNEKLVTADQFGNVKQISAKEILKIYSQNGNI